MIEGRKVFVVNIDIEVVMLNQDQQLKWFPMSERMPTGVALFSAPRTSEHAIADNTALVEPVK